MSDIITSPIKFLGATVLSISTSIGYGSSSESTLSVELIEDCELNDLFLRPEVGSPVYFNCGSFIFGGILTGWTENLSQSGKTFSVRASDPRQLLDNFALLVDTDVNPSPTQSFNVFNAREYWDSSTQATTDVGSEAFRKVGAECNGHTDFKFAKDNIKDPSKGEFGRAQSSDRGMKYRQIIDGLECASPKVYSNTGFEYNIDFESFPDKTLVPDFYRIQGNTTLLQLLQSICDILGFEFYVYLDAGDIIKIGLIDLKVQPGSFNGLVGQFKGCATDLSYGQELRHDKIKSIIYGDNYHENSEYGDFYFYFGAELYESGNGNDKILRHIVPQANNDDGCGFWVFKSVTELNATLHTPLKALDQAKKNGPYSISEMDIRAAMSGYSVWKARLFDSNIPGSFNRCVRESFAELTTEALRDGINNVSQTVVSSNGIVDATVQPIRSDQKSNKHSQKLQDLMKVYDWIKQLGDTYYGRQYLVPMKDIAYYLEDDAAATLANPEQANFMFTKSPTNAGGWTDPKDSVLGISDPILQFFRGDDGRVGAFASFPIEINNENNTNKWYGVYNSNSARCECVQRECAPTDIGDCVTSSAFDTKEACEAANNITPEED